MTCRVTSHRHQELVADCLAFPCQHHTFWHNLEYLQWKVQQRILNNLKKLLGDHFASEIPMRLGEQESHSPIFEADDYPASLESTIVRQT